MKYMVVNELDNFEYHDAVIKKYEEILLKSLENYCYVMVDIRRAFLLEDQTAW
jgi:hypothetical protein